MLYAYVQSRIGYHGTIAMYLDSIVGLLVAKIPAADGDDEQEDEEDEPEVEAAGGGARLARTGPALVRQMCRLVILVPGGQGGRKSTKN
jgi:hypothetical protein